MQEKKEQIYISLICVIVFAAKDCVDETSITDMILKFTKHD